jgi:hypothetical protein
MVVVTTRRQKRCALSKPLCQLKPQHALIEPQSPLQVRHLQVDMPHPHSGVNRLVVHIELDAWGLHPVPVLDAV